MAPYDSRRLGLHAVRHPARPRCVPYDPASRADRCTCDPTASGRLAIGSVDGHREGGRRAHAGGEGVPVRRVGLLAHRGGGAAGHPGDHGVRRAARAAQAARRGRPRRAVGGSVPGDLLPDRVGAGVVVGRRPAAPGRRGARPGGPRRGRRGPARPGHQHQAVAAVRPQLRVLLRGPAARPACSAPRWSQGVQSQGVGTSLKHFAANNQETDRLRVSADVDERTLREIYLPAFERVVTQAQPWTVMCSYNRLNGVYASEHPGCSPRCCATSGASTALVVSDWGAVHDRVAGAAAGLDLEMPPQLGRQRRGRRRRGPRRRARRVGARPGGRPGARAGRPGAGRRCTTARRSTYDAHHELAREVAARVRRAAQERRRLLPLRPRPARRSRVVGEFARTPRFQGAGSSQVNPTRVDVALDELRGARTRGVEVAFAAGFGWRRTTDDDAARGGGRRARRGRRRRRWSSSACRPPTSPRASTATHMDLPASQVELLDGVAGGQRPGRGGARQRLGGAHLALAAARPARSSSAGCPARPAGGAVADLLLGAGQPDRRLAETIPVRLEDSPSYLNFPGDARHVRYGEGVFVGYRGHDRARAAGRLPVRARPVLHDLRVQRPDVQVPAATPTATSRSRWPHRHEHRQAAGKEVVQVYVQDAEAAVARPPRELEGFAKVELARGRATRHVRARRARPVVLVRHRARLGARGRRVRAGGRRVLARPAQQPHGVRRRAARGAAARAHVLAAGVAGGPGRCRRAQEGCGHRRRRAARKGCWGTRTSSR